MGSDIYIPTTLFPPPSTPKTLVICVSTHPLQPLYFSHPHSLSLSPFSWVFFLTNSSQSFSIFSFFLACRQQSKCPPNRWDFSIFLWNLFSKWIYYSFCSTGWRFSLGGSLWDGGFLLGYFFWVAVWVWEVAVMVRKHGWQLPAHTFQV